MTDAVSHRPTEAPPLSKGDQADRGWDTYQERVLRNEGELEGLRRAVTEARATDRLLIEQRSDSLAAELERRADALERLAEANRFADSREARALHDALAELVSSQRHADLREFRDKVAEMSRADAERWTHNHQVDEERIHAHMTRYAEDLKHTREDILAFIDGRYHTYLVQREADDTARKLQAEEYARRLEVLNHAHERQVKFQENAVSRELWQADKDAQIQRESGIREQIIAIDKAMLTLQPSADADKARQAIAERASSELTNAVKILDTRIDGVDKIVDELRTAQERAIGSKGGISALAGWVIAGVGLLATLLTIVIIVANVLTSK